MSDAREVLDLDALVPKPGMVKYQGKEIEVKPPTTEQILKMSALGKRLEEGAEDSEKLVPLIGEMEAMIKELIPELAEAELTPPQLLGLGTLINRMAMPADSKALKAKGITPDSPKVA